MAKLNSMWLKGARGKVAGSTIYTSGGETIIRDGSSNVKNPKTVAQMIQRVIAKTVMDQYSALQPIVDHSFQGKSAGKQCMSEFLSRNMKMMRERASEIQAGGDSIYNYYQFEHVKQTKYTPAAVIISDGKLPVVPARIESDGSIAYIECPDLSSYGSVIDGFNLKRGDQLTFITIERSVQDGSYRANYARVILDPRNEDGTAADVNTTNIADHNHPNKPNFRNSGSFAVFEALSPGILVFKFSATSAVVAAGVIVSRKSHGTWLRSYCKLAFNESMLFGDAQSLGQAADRSVAGVEIYTDSEQYLNNAGTGGPEGTVQQGSGADRDPVYSESVLINGVAQDVSGGTVALTELRSIVVRGANLVGTSVTIEEAGVTAESQQFSGSGSSVSWTPDGGSLVVNTDTTYIIRRSSVEWFSILLRGASGGGME